MEWLLSIDQKFFLYINSHHSTWGDNLMTLVSFKYSWIPVYFFILVGLVRSWGFKKAAYIVVSIVPLILLSDQIASGLIKPSVQRLRPCHVEELKGLVHLVHGKCGGSYGFVSSHAANFFALATFLSGFFSYYFCIGALASALLVAYSRVYLGVHYPGDVIAGAIIGASIGLLVLYVFNKFVTFSVRSTHMNNPSDR